jgi:hypothetical protein
MEHPHGLGRARRAFGDGDLPAPGERGPYGHESLFRFNPNVHPAAVRLTVYFDNREPEPDVRVTVDAERVRCLRLDQMIGQRGFRVRYGQYALLVESDQPIIAQIGRLDVRQPNLAYCTVMGFPLE